jgi:hypothetical protein
MIEDGDGPPAGSGARRGGRPGGPWACWPYHGGGTP